VASTAFPIPNKTTAPATAPMTNHNQTLCFTCQKFVWSR
jgi:hypothetical protein